MPADHERSGSGAVAGVEGHAGFDSARQYPLISALMNRRTRRISRGLSFNSGAMTFASRHEPQPLSPLEEALLIAATGVSGLVLTDNPYQAEDGRPLTGTVLLRSTGLTAPSPDNAHATHWFISNDSGTYRIRHPDESDRIMRADELTPRELIEHIEKLKVRVLDHRLSFPRQFPAELHRNRFASNVPGSTMFIPVIELTEQYINGLLMLFSQEQKHRPVFYDDFRFYRPAGVQRFIRSGFLNSEVKLPLSVYGRAITEYESLFLTQNLALVAESMGLGGWLHWAPPPIILFGGTKLGRGLGFRFVKPCFREFDLPLPHFINRALRSVTRPAVGLRRKLLPFPAGMPNPVGLDGHIHAYCPPYYTDMDAAIDAILEKKLGRDGLYSDPRHFGRVMKEGVAQRFVEESPRYPDEAIECVRAVCRYIYETYGRFPAHTTAFHSQTWFQAHHLDLEYYDRFFNGAYSRAAAEHQRLWHPEDRL